MKLGISLDMRRASCRWVALVVQRTRERGLSALLLERGWESAGWAPRQAGKSGGARGAPRLGRAKFQESGGLLFAHAPVTLDETTL